jgi:hypothetical protein
MLVQIGRKARRISVCTFLAAVPLGVELPEERDGEVTFGVHGGGGQVITVMRDCEGNAISSESSPFTELSGSVEYGHPVNDTASFVFGLRGGRISGERQLPADTDGFTSGPGDTRFTYHYFNPHLSFEGRTAGIGFGYFAGDVPVMFDDADQSVFSFHLRLGRLDQLYFKVAANESQPLLTGGGPWMLGLGYAPSSRFGGFTGLSAGFYDGMGVGQTFVIGIDENVLLDLGFRLATTENEFDGGASAGLRFRFDSP